MSIFENTVLITAKPSIGKLVAKYLLIVLAVLSLIGTIMFSPFGLIVPTILLFVFAYYMNLSCNMEYEYTYIEGELSIDKIKAKRKRKRVAKIDTEDLLLIAPQGSGELNQYVNNRETKQMDATSGMPDRKIYAVVYRHGISTNLVYFEPDQKMLETIQVRNMRKVIL